MLFGNKITKSTAKKEFFFAANSCSYFTVNCRFRDYSWLKGKKEYVCVSRHSFYTSVNQAIPELLRDKVIADRRATTVTHKQNFQFASAESSILPSYQHR